MGAAGAHVCYLHTVFTFEALATVVGHLVSDEVGLPVEGLGALITLVLSLLRVHNHVLLQAVHGQGDRSHGGPACPPAYCAPWTPPTLLGAKSESRQPVCPPPAPRQGDWMEGQGQPSLIT